MLTVFTTPFRDLQLMQTSWSAQLNPLLALPLSSGQILSNVSLVTGSTNFINHKLSRKLQGWFVVRQRALASIYDAQDSNQNPVQTLALITSADVSVDLFVF